MRRCFASKNLTKQFSLHRGEEWHNRKNRVAAIGLFLLLCVCLFLVIGCEKRKKIDHLNIAHRGVDWGIPENTAAAIMEAYRNGYAGVEIDVFVTADGVPVLSHDPVVSGKNEGKELSYSIIDTRWNVLKELVLYESVRYGRIGISSLEEGLDVCKRYGLWAVLHIKTEDHNLDTLVAESVLNKDLGQSVMYNVGMSEKRREAVLAVDPAARFHIPFRQLESYQGNIDNVIATIHIDHIKEAAGNSQIPDLYIWGVNRNNFQTAYSYNPLFVEFEEKIFLSLLSFR